MTAVTSGSLSLEYRIERPIRPSNPHAKPRARIASSSIQPCRLPVIHPSRLEHCDRTVSASQIDAINGLVRTYISDHRIPGLSLAVVAGGRIVFAEGYGLADVENSVPAAADTIFRIASVSKPVTSVGAMRLVESGNSTSTRRSKNTARHFQRSPGPLPLGNSWHIRAAFAIIEATRRPSTLATTQASTRRSPNSPAIRWNFSPEPRCSTRAMATSFSAA